MVKYLKAYFTLCILLKYLYVLNIILHFKIFNYWVIIIYIYICVKINVRIFVKIVV